MLLGKASPDVPGGQRDSDGAQATAGEISRRGHAGILVVIVVAAVAIATVVVVVTVIVVATVPVVAASVVVSAVVAPVVVSAVAAVVVVVVVVIVRPSLGFCFRSGLSLLLLALVLLRFVLLRLVLPLVLPALRVAAVVIVVLGGLRGGRGLRRGSDGLRWAAAAEPRGEGEEVLEAVREARAESDRPQAARVSAFGSVWDPQAQRPERPRSEPPRGARRSGCAARAAAAEQGAENWVGRQQLAAAPLQIALDLRRQPDGLLLLPGAGGARQRADERRAGFLLLDDLGGSVNRPQAPAPAISRL